MVRPGPGPGRGCDSGPPRGTAYAGVFVHEARSLRVSASVFPLLEPRLPSVSKPIQYVGGELNSTVKEWELASTSAGR